jgi:UDP-N-acetylglucosamine--N-acetylmuramyl-(pentapeptide) pyrophosphoryl-undecaprenol N-acetylglucosamine transferase
VVPALAVADALRAEGVEVAFIGGARAEAELVPAAGFPLYTLPVEGLSRTRPLRALRALALAGAALPRARALLAKLAPDAAMGAGGYVAGPVGLAALSLRIPLVLTEADSHLGLTNRALAPFARRVCLAFPLAGRDSGRYRVTGRPTAPPAQDRQAARARLGIEPDETCVLVFGGSLGAHSINIATVEAFAGRSSRGGSSPVGADLHVLHVCGRRDYPELSARALEGTPHRGGHPEKRTLGGTGRQAGEPRPGYDLREYLELADFDRALAAADLVVARAGGSVFEIAAHGLPAILVPYPHASADHQSANARWMSEAGAALVIADAELSASRLAAEVAALLADSDRLRKMSAAARLLARPRAAQDVADELLAAIPA